MAASASVGLLTLSNELLIAILTACPDVPTAIALTSVNRRLRSIWLEHSGIIIETLLRPTIAAFDEALRLAKGELRLAELRLDQAHVAAQGDDGAYGFPLRDCLPGLLRNAELSASAHRACTAHRPANRRHYTSSPASYYFIRRLVLAYELKETRQWLLEELTAMSLDKAQEHVEFILFFFSRMDIAEAWKHAAAEEVMASRYNGGRTYPDVDEDAISGGWEWASDVLLCARDDKAHGLSGLEEEIWKERVELGPDYMAQIVVLEEEKERARVELGPAFMARFPML